MLLPQKLTKSLPDLKKIERGLLLTFLISLPFSINVIINAPVIYAGGKFSPYLTSFLYFQDILLCLSLIIWGLLIIKKQTGFSLGNQKIILGLILFFIFSQIALIKSPLSPQSFLILIKEIELVLIYVLFSQNFLKTEEIAYYLGLTLIFQSLVSLGQYLTQGSLGLAWLGESVLSQTTAGVAKIDLFSEKIIRGYGTMPHPNILAGFLNLGLFLSIHLYPKNKIMSIVSAVILSLGLVSTFSRTAMIAALVGGIIYVSARPNIVIKIKNKKKWLLITSLIVLIFTIVGNFIKPLEKRFLKLPKNAEIEERLEYSKISLKSLPKNPLGLGFGRFTEVMQNFTDKKLLPWQHQPVHNVFLLMASELGLGGLLLIITGLILLIKNIIKNTKNFISEEAKRTNQIWLGLITSLIILGLFDHYFFSLYQGQIMVMILLSLSNITSGSSQQNIQKIS